MVVDLSKNEGGDHGNVWLGLRLPAAPPPSLGSAVNVRMKAPLRAAAGMGHTLPGIIDTTHPTSLNLGIRSVG